MGNTLRSVSYHNSTICMNQFSSQLHGILYSQHVRNKRHSDKLSLFGNTALKIFFRNGTVIFRLDIFEHCPGGSCHHLPGQYVTMVLHDSDQYLITLMQIVKAIGICHEVQRFGGIAHKNDFFIMLCTYEVSHFMP